MELKINLGKDLYKLHMQLGSVKNKHLPFAMSKALNSLAEQAKALEQEEYKEHLQIRNKGLLKKGIQINYAKKSSFVNMSSEVGIIKDFNFLTDHALRYTRVARSPMGRAIPVAIKRSASGKITSSKKPSALLKKNANFIMTTKSGVRMIVSRVGKDRLPIKVYYKLSPKAEIKKTIDFESKVRAMVSSRFDIELGKQLSLAIKTAK